MCGLMSNLVICKHRKECDYAWHRTGLFKTQPSSLAVISVANIYMSLEKRQELQNLQLVPKIVLRRCRYKICIIYPAVLQTGLQNGFPKHLNQYNNGNLVLVYKVITFCRK